ncbi:MAG: metal ABC transporter permease [Lachnospiraceae bacterium]|nr:metal ABC transporter permease [Lachnospiraceae bacterium]
MIGLIPEMFTYPFMCRAFAVGSLIALCAALLGVTLVLKRYSMIGDGLSHVGFGALAIASAMNAAPLAVAIPVVMAAAVALLYLSENSRIHGDAAIALISTGSLAVGVTVVSMTTGMNTDVYNYLFGSILSMSEGDVVLTAVISAAVLVVFLLFYNRIFAVTFDETFARATGIRTGRLSILIAVLTALVIVIGMRMMGSLLISSLVVFPALTSMRVFKTFRGVMISAGIVSVVCLLLGLTISYLHATPTGASIVLCNIAAFFIYLGISKVREKTYNKG